MGWGIQVNADIFVSRVRLQDIDSTIEENNKTITFCEKELLMFASSTPKDVVSEDVRQEGDIIIDLRFKIDEIFETYSSCIKQNVLLEIIKENIEKAIEE